MCFSSRSRYHVILISSYGVNEYRKMVDLEYNHQNYVVTYKIVWNPVFITWYFSGNKLLTLNKHNPDLWMIQIPDQPMHIHFTLQPHTWPKENNTEDHRDVEYKFNILKVAYTGLAYSFQPKTELFIFGNHTRFHFVGIIMAAVIGIVLLVGKCSFSFAYPDEISSTVSYDYTIMLNDPD